MLLRDRRSSIDGIERELKAIDPREVLKRGYSMTTLPDGTLVRSAKAVAAGAAMDTHFADGVVRSTVAGKRVRRQSKTSPAADQMDLFDARE